MHDTIKIINSVYIICLDINGNVVRCKLDGKLGFINNRIYNNEYTHRLIKELSLEDNLLLYKEKIRYKVEVIYNHCLSDYDRDITTSFNTRITAEFKYNTEDDIYYNDIIIRLLDEDSVNYTRKLNVLAIYKRLKDSNNNEYKNNQYFKNLLDNYFCEISNKTSEN